MNISVRGISRAVRFAVLGVVVGGLTATTGAHATGRDAAAPPPGRASLGEVAVVPLDDRPYTLYDPQKLAAGAGYESTVPERGLLGRHATPGDGRAVGNWLVGAARRADASVVALPMLAYGGLLNSRNSSVAIEEARHRLQAVRTVKRQNPGERLYAFDAIMRLTPEGPWRNQLRVWATLVDEVENLGEESKRPQLEDLERQVPREVREDYLATRARNHQINLQMIDWAAEGVIDFLVVGQDDASGTGLHRPEAASLRQHIADLGVGDRVRLYPGADVVASLLLARIAVEDAGISPAVYVEYSRVHGDSWVAPFQNIPYAELIASYVDTVGGRMTTSIDDADVVLMANTGGSSASVQPFADRVAGYLRQGRTVALGDDAIAGRTDPRLTTLLDVRIRRGQLDSYSGWNIGIPIAQSLSRQALLARAARGDLLPGDESSAAPVQAFRRALLTRAARSDLELTLSEWVQTDSYRNVVRDQTTAYASSLGEPDPQNLRWFYADVNAFAGTHTEPRAQQLFDQHFRGVDRVVGMIGGRTEHLRPGGVQAWNLYLPWLRTGEIAAEPVTTG